MDPEVDWAEEPLEDDPVEDEEQAVSTPLVPPRFREDLSINYVGTVYLIAMLLLIIGAFGFLSWWVVLSIVVLLLTTLVEGWQRVTLGAGAAVGVVVVITVISSLGEDAPPIAAPASSVPAVEQPIPPSAGSLGIYVDDVSDLWNTVDGDPRIQRGLTHQTEPGEYDAFVYRFGEWGRLIGAYDDETRAMYGLLATGQLSGPATESLYIHLCFVVAPYSQECLDSYREEGLSGGTLSDFVNLDHESAWSVGAHSWSLEIEQNVMSLRVFGEDVP